LRQAGLFPHFPQNHFPQNNGGMDDSRSFAWARASVGARITPPGSHRRRRCLSRLFPGCLECCNKCGNGALSVWRHATLIVLRIGQPARRLCLGRGIEDGRRGRGSRLPPVPDAGQRGDPGLFFPAAGNIRHKRHVLIRWRLVPAARWIPGEYRQMNWEQIEQQWAAMTRRVQGDWPSLPEADLGPMDDIVSAISESVSPDGRRDDPVQAAALRPAPASRGCWA